MTFAGHAIPASFFFGFGIYLLLLTLHRARSSDGPLSQFIPEKNKLILWRAGLLILIATLLGMIYEAGAGIVASQPLRHILHLCLYLAFTVVGVVLLLEAKCRLPPDSYRIALVVAFVVEYVLWTEHAHMKTGLEEKTHIVMGQICAACAIMTICSICKPTSVVLYIAAWGLLVLQAMWLVTLGVCDLGHCFRMDRVGSYFCLEILVLFLIMALTAASVYNEGEKEKDSFVTKKANEEYESLAVTDDTITSIVHGGDAFA